MQLVLATRNEHKLRELSRVLTGIEFLALPDDLELPPETGATFAENALIKARAAYEATGVPAIADDSGIEAAALGGAPGVRSARFAARDASDEENLALLLERLQGRADRRVAYVCALAYVAEGAEEVFQGHCEGRLAAEPRGTAGFGYDPAFVPEGDDPGDTRTMAELEPEEKDGISHRGRAARKLASYLAAIAER
jgi:XTP/dITP diphosphohydrolase